MKSICYSNILTKSEKDILKALFWRKNYSMWISEKVKMCSPEKLINWLRSSKLEKNILKFYSKKLIVTKVDTLTTLSSQFF